MTSPFTTTKSRRARPTRLDPASVHEFVEDLVGEDPHAQRVLSLANGVTVPAPLLTRRGGPADRRRPLQLEGSMGCFFMGARLKSQMGSWGRDGAMDEIFDSGGGARHRGGASRSQLVARVAHVTPEQLHNNRFFFGGVAVLRLRTEGAAVIVECRMTPWLSLTSALFFGTLLAMAIADGARSIGALFVVLLWIFNVTAAIRSRQVFSPVLLAGICELGERLRR